MEINHSLKPENENLGMDNPTSSIDSVDEIIEVSYSEDQTHLSVTAVLSYCKRKILRPYLYLLSVMGLRPLMFDRYEINFLCEIISHFYVFLLTLFMVVGYILQYMTCLRRDRGFCYTLEENNANNIILELNGVDRKEVFNKVCQGSVIFSFLTPSGFHLFGYLYAVYTIRSSNDDQLPSLMERVFVASSHTSNGFTSQKRLVKILWFVILTGSLWIFLSLISIILMLIQGSVAFRWIDESWFSTVVVLKIFLVICTFLHDIVQATVISNYCLQAQLLISYLQFLREKLMESPVQALEWMREIYEFKNLLRYLNEELAPSVCLFLFIGISWTTSGIVWCLGLDKIDILTFPIVGVSILTICLWAMVSLAPFVQAARLTNACELIKGVGHEVRIRPFVHQDTPAHDLNSLLLFASTLNMNAKLFKMPIKGRFLAAFLTGAGILLLVLGECHYIQ